MAKTPDSEVLNAAYAELPDGGSDQLDYTHAHTHTTIMTLLQRCCILLDEAIQLFSACISTSHTMLIYCEFIFEH